MGGFITVRKYGCFYVHRQTYLIERDDLRYKKQRLFRKTRTYFRLLKDTSTAYNLIQNFISYLMIFLNIVPKRDDNTCFYYFLIVRCLSLKLNVGFLLVYLQRLTELPRETAGNVTACAEIVKRDVYSLYQEFRQIDFVLFWHINLLLVPSKFFRKSC